MRSDGDMTTSTSQDESPATASQADVTAADGTSVAPDKDLSRATPRLSRWLDENLGGAGFVRRSMRHIFPDHWSFFLGEIALYCFIVLVITGIFLSLFFKASGDQVIYQGSYAPLRGTTMSAAYSSVLQITFDVRGGLLIRQIHHWAALVFIGALLLHVCRMFFTGAYRRPRRVNWLIGVTLLILVIAAGFTGILRPRRSALGNRPTHHLLDHRIHPAHRPLAGLAHLWRNLPEQRLRGAAVSAPHLPAARADRGAAGCCTSFILWRQKHTVYRSGGGDDKTIVGTRLFPNYALRTGGYFFLVGGMLAALGAFLQINPVWLYGPYNPVSATSAAQPDWYTGWLEGALRLFPAWDIHIGGFLLPAIFWPGVVLPLVALRFSLLLAVDGRPDQQGPRLPQRSTGRLGSSWSDRVGSGHPRSSRGSVRRRGGRRHRRYLRSEFPHPGLDPAWVFPGADPGSGGGDLLSVSSSPPIAQPQEGDQPATRRDAGLVRARA